MVAEAAVWLPRRKRDYRSVDRISLGSFAESRREGTHLCRIDDHHGNLSSSSMKKTTLYLDLKLIWQFAIRDAVSPPWIKVNRLSCRTLALNAVWLATRHMIKINPLWTHIIFCNTFAEVANEITWHCPGVMDDN